MLRKMSVMGQSRLLCEYLLLPLSQHPKDNSLIADRLIFHRLCRGKIPRC